MEFPTGVSFYTGDAARDRRKLEERQITVLRSRGFEEVISPVFEYYQPEPGGEADRVYSFPDRATGRMLALRWDFTLQAARQAARRMEEGSGSTRWFYRGNVFRPVKEHAGQKRQIYQLGAELFGEGSLESTAGMIDLAAELLRASELKEFSVVVGHVGFVNALMRLLKLPSGSEPDFREVLRMKDLSRLKELGRELSLRAELVEKVGEAMYLMGGAEVLDRVAGIVPDGEVLGELRELHRQVENRDLILFDLTEPRGFDYYTGVMFQAVLPSIGQEVIKGGRYDDLLGRFGRPSPAVGFALDLDLIMQAAGEARGKS